MSSLRERQKEDRGKRIVDSARALFKQKGYEQSTIENIAEVAGVSGVTVHNYYGTKAGVLLALVVESDEAFVDRLGEELPEVPGDIVGTMLKFTEVLLDHAMSYLEKSIWRQVIAAVTLGADTNMAREYAALDQRLADILAERVKAKQDAGLLGPEIVAQNLGNAIFKVINARFIDFITDEECSVEATKARVADDLQALFAVGRSWEV